MKMRVGRLALRDGVSSVDTLLTSMPVSLVSNHWVWFDTSSWSLDCVAGIAFGLLRASTSDVAKLLAKLASARLWSTSWQPWA